MYSNFTEIRISNVHTIKNAKIVDSESRRLLLQLIIGILLNQCAREGTVAQ